jgi:hypothetical protein
VFGAAALNGLLCGDVAGAEENGRGDAGAEDGPAEEERAVGLGFF